MTDDKTNQDVDGNVFKLVGSFANIIKGGNLNFFYRKKLNKDTQDMQTEVVQLGNSETKLAEHEG